jgi:hypothetical protein
MNWIKCSDMMPEDAEPVLGYFPKSKEVSEVYWDGEEDSWVCHEISYEKEEVTHWMPLPEKPEE